MLLETRSWHLGRGEERIKTHFFMHVTHLFCLSSWCSAATVQLYLARNTMLYCPNLRAPSTCHMLHFGSLL
ncbi:hypothetical protein GN956_G16054 [Arapaima gigas]